METMLKVSDLLCELWSHRSTAGVSVEVKKDRLYRSLVRMEPEKKYIIAYDFRIGKAKIRRSRI